MKQQLRITRRAFCCIATIALIVFGARFSTAADFGSPPAKHPSIIGTWITHAEDGTKSTYVFKADNSLLRIVEDPKVPGSYSAKYRIDYSTKPIHVDIFDFNDPSLKDVTVRAILEFDGRSRFRFSASARGERAEEFGENAQVFTREEVSPAAEHPSIIGAWIGHEDGPAGSFDVTLVFKADNTMLWITEGSKGLDSFNSKYTIDYSTKPIQLDMFDVTPLIPGEREDLRMRGILEFDGESRFRFNVDSERPKEIYKDTPFFTKVQ